MGNETFIEMYDKVFNSDGAIKACGRNTTSRLIELAMELRPDVDFGDNMTGFMNVESIQNLYNELSEGSEIK